MLRSTFRKRARPVRTAGDSRRVLLYCGRPRLYLLAAGLLLIPHWNAHPRLPFSATAGDFTAITGAAVTGYRFQAFSGVLAAAELIPGTAERSPLWSFVDEGMFDPRQDYWNHSEGLSSHHATGSNST